MNSKKLIWKVEELFKKNDKNPGAAYFVYGGLDDKHKFFFKKYNCRVTLNFDLSKYPQKISKGFPDWRRDIFFFSISPRYNHRTDFLNLEFPFRSSHKILDSGYHHNEWKTLEEGIDYAEKIYYILIQNLQTVIYN